MRYVSIDQQVSDFLTKKKQAFEPIFKLFGYELLFDEGLIIRDHNGKNHPVIIKRLSSGRIDLAAIECESVISEGETLLYRYISPQQHTFIYKGKDYNVFIEYDESKSLKLKVIINGDHNIIFLRMVDNHENSNLNIGVMEPNEQTSPSFNSQFMYIIDKKNKNTVLNYKDFVKNLRGQKVVNSIKYDTKNNKLWLSKGSIVKAYDTTTNALPTVCSVQHIFTLVRLIMDRIDKKIPWCKTLISYPPFAYHDFLSEESNDIKDQKIKKLIDDTIPLK